MPLHPFIDAMLAKLAGRPMLSAGSPEEARAMVAAGRQALGAGPDLAVVRDIAIPTRSGSVPARYLASSDAPDGLLLYLHGGGWVVGALDDFDVYARTLAAESGYGVLLLDYRLAPEHPFPAGLEDCIDVLAACIEAKVTGVPVTSPLVVAGDSAGANLATVAIRKSARRDSVALQVLYYPVADCDFASSSYIAHADGVGLTAHDMEWFFRHYAPSELWSSPDISPLRAGDLPGMPPAIIVTAEYDVLCDEGEAYAAMLRKHGVPVTLRRLDGLTHGFVRLHNLFDVPMNELKAVAAEISAAGAAHSRNLRSKGQSA